ncbi:hypothetical protein TWF694_008524 [Orbilia ellipsospora]|uniref:Uncharacterized protein n=1 Tax=Orbilia ellipsospora TaxID=2528407 RepID=A0AAV9XGV1_9PEZI
MSGLSMYPPETHGGVTTSWVPIGTAFPSSRGCESLFWSVVANTLAAWDPGYGISVDSNTRCVPPAATTWWDQDRLGANSLTVISIGPITCPSAYSTVTTSVENESSTFVACCPPNYTFVEIEDRGITGECSSELPANQEVSYAIRNEANNWVITSTSYSTATPIWGIPIHGYNIVQQITSPTSTTATSPNSSTGSASPPATGTNTPQPSSGLSTGAKAGIGVGVAVGALLLGVLMFIFIIQRRRKRTISDEDLQPPPALPSADPKPPTNAELEGWRGAQVYEVQNFSPPVVHEVHGRNAPVELGPRY